MTKINNSVTDMKFGAYSYPEFLLYYFVRNQ